MNDAPQTVLVTKIVHGGQGLAELDDGKKVFVWNALPGETVSLRVIKQRHSYAEAIAEEVVAASPERIQPVEVNYLATSPWQMMTYMAENKYKEQIVRDLFTHEGVKFPDFSLTAVAEENSELKPSERLDVGTVYGYRNKMEYSFWGDDDGLHLALHQRGSHGKQIVDGSKLAMPSIDLGANSVLAQLRQLPLRAGDLKTIIVRSSQKGDTVAALYVKLKQFPKLKLPVELKGLRVYHSNPKSPASVRTELLQELGNCTLQDELLDKTFTYDVDSFFQVNLPIFEQALRSIKGHCIEPAITDMYAGVGSIGLSVADKSVDLIELDPATMAMARVNASASHLNVRTIEASTEKALEYITNDKPVIFDPPRAGLHDRVVERVLDVMPPKIIYLSCNPATQARDLARLQAGYNITYFEVFNFFPRTPHIESLAILELK